VVKEEVAISRAVVGLVGPKPTVLVTCAGERGKPNIITIAAVTAASHDPQVILVGRTKEFVVNVIKRRHHNL